IADISWAKWHRAPRQISWPAFRDAFGSPADGLSDGLTRFAVTFSRPVEVESLQRPQAIAMTLTTYEAGTGWRVLRRVPITRLATRSAPDLPANLTRQVRIEIDPDWRKDEIYSHDSWLTGRSFDVEIEIRGDLIVDCSGQTVDADTPGLKVAPSGDGVP